MFLRERSYQNPFSENKKRRRYVAVFLDSPSALPSPRESGGCTNVTAVASRSEAVLPKTVLDLRCALFERCFSHNSVIRSIIGVKSWVGGGGKNENIP